MDSRWTGFLGLVCFVGVAWLASSRRSAFPWRTVITGMSLQAVFAIFILKTSWGRLLFEGFQAAVERLIGFANVGASMVFGPLANPEVLGSAFGPKQGLVLAVTLTSTIILVSALFNWMYHIGLLPRVVWVAGWVMRRVMGTSGSESLAAAANIFMGMAETPLVIKPYLLRMTKSELHALMVGGMATLGGGMLATYVGLGISAGHLLTASVMSAPAGLVLAKILVPESEASETGSGARMLREDRSRNALDSICLGASEGLQLAMNVIAMLIAFVALIALGNFVFQSLQSWIGVSSPVRLEQVVGWLNAPFAWLMGVPWKDCPEAGELLGQRIVLNEFVSYVSLSETRDSLDPRSVTIATYALCGFANLGSIAIQIGGIGALAPERRQDAAMLGLRSMLGGLLACYMTAAIVGILD